MRHHKAPAIFYWFSRRFSKTIQSKLDQKAEIFFISFPKSGRSWIRLMLGKYLCNQYDVPEKYITNIFLASSKAGVPVTMFTHDTFNDRGHHHFSSDKSQYQGKKVIFMTRNIKDVMVSLYFQMSKRLKSIETKFTDYLWGWNSPVMNFLHYHKVWYENKSVPLDFLHITYEGTKKNPEETLLRILRFMDVDEINPAIVKRSVAYASFENMKTLERKGKINDFRFQPGDRDDPESFKTRRGMIGGYVDYLDEDDIELIDFLASRLGNPFVTL